MTKTFDHHVLPFNYYHSFQGLDDFSEYIFDKQGIPQVQYGGDIGLQYNPITIIQYGLWQLENYVRSNQDQAFQKAVLAGDWLVSNVEENHKSGCTWTFNFSLRFYGPQAPWISSMSQGEAISFLLRLYQVKSNNRYLEIAREAVKPFYLQIKEGGVLTELEDGCPIFEEFPTQPAPHVFNGHIFALLGLYDYTRFFDDDRALLLFENATTKLSANLFRWDTGYWSRYDLHKTRRLASPMYHLLHIRLLNTLFEITRETIYLKYAQRWEKFLRNPLCKTLWLINKIIEKIKLFSYQRNHKRDPWN